LSDFDSTDGETEEVPFLTDVGWEMVEIIERMLDKNFSIADIEVAMDCSAQMIALLLAQARLERTELEIDARDLSI
jgi:hypothetical protein